MPIPSLFSFGFGFLGQTETPNYVSNCFDEVAQEQGKRTTELKLAYDAQNFGFPLGWRQKEQVESCSKSNTGVSIGALFVDAFVLSTIFYFVLKSGFSKK